jgi:hypothetical protein
MRLSIHCLSVLLLGSLASGAPLPPPSDPKPPPSGIVHLLGTRDTPDKKLALSPLQPGDKEEMPAYIRNQLHTVEQGLRDLHNHVSQVAWIKPTPPSTQWTVVVAGTASNSDWERVEEQVLGINSRRVEGMVDYLLMRLH